jgi:hypothetical protein
VDDETLTPFVDALSASLIIMILIAISFILQNAIAIHESAKEFVDFEIDEESYTPIAFRRPIKIDYESKEILFLVNFELNEEEVTKIRNEILQNTTLTLHVKSKQSDRKSTANLIRFLSMMDLPKNISVKTHIETSKSTVSYLTWSK